MESVVFKFEYQIEIDINNDVLKVEENRTVKNFGHQKLNFK